MKQIRLLLLFLSILVVTPVKADIIETVFKESPRLVVVSIIAVFCIRALKSIGRSFSTETADASTVTSPRGRPPRTMWRSSGSDDLRKPKRLQRSYSDSSPSSDD